MSLLKRASYGWRRTRMTLQIKSAGFGQSILPNWLMHKHDRRPRSEQTALARRERSTRHHVSMNLCIASRGYVSKMPPRWQALFPRYQVKTRGQRRGIGMIFFISLLLQPPLCRGLLLGLAPFFFFFICLNFRLFKSDTPCLYVG